MAVEDHPLFKEWSNAIDRYQKLNEFYNQLQSKRQPDDPLLEQARRERDEALREYQRISDEL